MAAASPESFSGAFPPGGSGTPGCHPRSAARRHRGRGQQRRPWGNSGAGRWAVCPRGAARLVLGCTQQRSYLPRAVPRADARSPTGIRKRCPRRRTTRGRARRPRRAAELQGRSESRSLHGRPGCRGVGATANPGAAPTPRPGLAGSVVPRRCLPCAARRQSRSIFRAGEAGAGGGGAGGRGGRERGGAAAPSPGLRRRQG